MRKNNKPTIQRYALSDPWHDFTNEASQELLQGIINKQGYHLTATDLMIIFDPILPAGTVQENVSYLAPAFNFIDQHLGQIIEDEQTRGFYDFWEKLCRWSFRYKDELMALNQYDFILQKLRQVMERMLRFEWDLTKELGILFYYAQLLIDTIGLEILRDISPDYPRCILENFMSDSDRDAAIALYFYEACHEDFYAISKEADLLKSIYTTDLLLSHWDRLDNRYRNLGEIPTPGYACSVKTSILDSVQYIL